ncbi:MAG: hypothetical protein C4530_24110, partial [Desulfobacteraceae bacterium]
MGRISLLIVCLSFFIVSLSPADELGFETNQEGIVRGLTRSLPQEMGATRGFPGPAAKTRGVRAIIVE